MIVYVNTASYAEHVALIKGDLVDRAGADACLNVLSDVLGEKVQAGRCRSSQPCVPLPRSRGVVVCVNRATSLSDQVHQRASGDDPGENGQKLWRRGADSLDLGINDMILLSNTAQCCRA